MDTFVDKLVDRINSQGAVRTQHMRVDDGHSRVSEKKQAEMLQHLADMEDKLAKSFTENVTESVKDANAYYVEMITAYKNENQQAREEAVSSLTEQIHSENVKCYRNTKAAMEEIVKAGTEEVSEKVSENVKKSVSEMLTGLKTGKGNGGVIGLLIVVMLLLLLNLGGIAAILLTMFGFIPTPF